ncbi:hypothetical protein NQ315_004148 [Exocentrus adspersus]|uniref:Uncharacterized protein n=1 Tax=Exocentrus adspersus TaxID=1586481 RepID=A0AAV8W8N4_9CUCU|nr:hypothetical protein NQ315_004148 [Exocentrus adspersus]
MQFTILCITKLCDFSYLFDTDGEQSIYRNPGIAPRGKLDVILCYSSETGVKTKCTSTSCSTQRRLTIIEKEGTENN